MRRRDLIKVIGGAGFAAWPVASRAQPSTAPVVGFLNSATPDPLAPRVRAFRHGLSDAGYVEGRNVAIEYRWAEYRFDRLPDLARDLVRHNVNVIVTGYNLAAAQAAKAATDTIPIVFISGVDPVRTGLVASLNQPGSNVTGVSILANELIPKQIEVLHELVPKATTIAALLNPANKDSSQNMSEYAQTAAKQIGVQLSVLYANNDAEIAAAFVSIQQQKIGALMIAPDAFFDNRNEVLATLALRDAVPTIGSFRSYAAAGGLMSYGGSVADQGRQVGIYTGRILNGERPRDLPVVLITKIELAINLRTAKALGLTIPLPLLGRTDEVIE